MPIQVDLLKVLTFLTLSWKRSVEILTALLVFISENI